MNQKNVGVKLFFFVAAVSVAVAFLPLVRGGRLNVVFLGVAIVFFILGLAARKKA